MQMSMPLSAAVQTNPEKVPEFNGVLLCEGFDEGSCLITFLDR
jgi:hypothetical protein